MFRARHPMLVVVLTTGCHLLSSGAIDETCEDLPTQCDLESIVDTHEPTSTGDDTGEPVDSPIEFDELVPFFGTNAGGGEVTISGQGLTRINEVRFGEAIGTIVNQAARTLVVQTPSTDEEGPVDIHLRTQEGTDEGGIVIPGAFVFHGDQTGNVRLAGILQTYQPLSSEATTFLKPSATAYVVAPEPTSDLSLYGGDEERCINGRFLEEGILQTAGLLDLNLPNIWIIGQATGATIDLPWDSATRSFDSTDFSNDVYVDGEEYLVGSFTTDEFDFDLPGALRAPITLEVIKVQNQRPDPDQNLFEVSRDPQITWLADPASSSDRIVIEMTNTGPGPQETVSCLANDDGHKRVDGELWSAFPPGQVIEIKIARVEETSTIWPEDNGQSRWITLNWQVMVARAI